MPTIETSLTSNANLQRWVAQIAQHCRPDRVHWCDGSEAERRMLTDRALAEGVLLPLNPAKRPGSYLHRSNPNDAARVEQLTFVCTPTKAEAGPLNNWMDPEECYAKMRGLYEGSMKGRTMYVVPYVMGPIGSEYAKVGIELTDSVYVALSMRIMTRMGRAALDRLGNGDDFNRGLHSVRDCHPERRFICHFPQDNTIWSVGSGYGGNALLGKKCLALRIGSYLARNEGWLAEHMLILEAESPEGRKNWVAAAFPSACGKTNFAMMVPPQRFAGWKIRTVGDDIAWMKVGKDGRLWAVNPEFGFFGVAPGTNSHSNPNAMASVAKDSLFTNVALTSDGDVWWEGMDGPTPDGLVDWQGRPWSKDSGPAAHPNSRFTAPATNNPVLSGHWDDPEGVPISAVIFGGRRSTTVPLVLQSFNWSHGVYLGATMGSETTAAAAGKVGVVRRDPMAMLPFCGYDIGSYFTHWLSMQARIAHPPKLFMVNWFRKGPDGKFLWPGYGENMRVLKWIIDRANGTVGGEETRLGWVPRPEHLDLTGLDATAEAVQEVNRIDYGEWRQEVESQAEFFKTVGPTLPRTLELERALIASRLSDP